MCRRFSIADGGMSVKARLVAGHQQGIASRTVDPSERNRA